MSNNFKISFRISKLYLKFLSPFMLIIFIIILGVIFYNISISDEKIREENTDVMIDFYTTEIETTFNYYFDILLHYNHLINDFTIIDSNYRRNFYSELTKYIISKNTNIKALWVDFDANKFDNLDDQYKNTAYYSETGRFNLFWNRIYNRRKTEIEFQKYSVEEQKLNLLKPCCVQARDTKQFVIAMDNSDISNIVYTFSLPVFDKDSNVIGITGLEIDIQDIINLLDNYKMKMNLVKSYTFLSNKGIYLYNSDATIIGKILSNQYINYSNTDSILKELPKNKTISIDVTNNKELATYFFIPIKVKNIYNTDTYINILINNTYIDNDRFIWQVFLYCFIFFVLLFIIIFFTLIVIEDILLNRTIASFDKEKIKRIE